MASCSRSFTGRAPLDPPSQMLSSCETLPTPKSCFWKSLGTMQTEKNLSTPGRSSTKLNLITVCSSFLPDDICELVKDERVAFVKALEKLVRFARSPYEASVDSGHTPVTTGLQSWCLFIDPSAIEMQAVLSRQNEMNRSYYNIQGQLMLISGTK